MKKFVFIVLLALCAAPLVGAAGSGTAASGDADRKVRPAHKTVTETREVRAFDGISATSGIVVLVRQADEHSVEVTADKNIIEYVLTETAADGTLRIRYRENLSFCGGTTTVVKVACPELTHLQATSGAEITCTDLIEGEKLSVSATSASRIEGAVRYERLTVSTTSGADITLTGRCANSTVSATSGSETDLSALISKRAEASATSGATVRILAEELLEAKATSGADIFYYGEPQLTDFSASSGARIHKRL